MSGIQWKARPTLEAGGPILRTLLEGSPISAKLAVEDVGIVAAAGRCSYAMVPSEVSPVGANEMLDPPRPADIRRSRHGKRPRRLAHTDVDAARGNRRCTSSAEAPWKHARERMTTVGHVLIHGGRGNGRMIGTRRQSSFNSCIAYVAFASKTMVPTPTARRRIESTWSPQGIEIQGSGYRNEATAWAGAPDARGTPTGMRRRLVCGCTYRPSRCDGRLRGPAGPDAGIG
ncbi:predicted protein [Postia placenta Mad-698-R]|nr:predicted protein [Postia placenta Mad-698-R]